LFLVKWGTLRALRGMKTTTAIHRRIDIVCLCLFHFVSFPFSSYCDSINSPCQFPRKNAHQRRTSVNTELVSALFEMRDSGGYPLFVSFTFADLVYIKRLDYSSFFSYNAHSYRYLSFTDWILWGIELCLRLFYTTDR